MANTVTNTRILTGSGEVIQYVCIDSDGTEETDLVVYDSSAVATLLGKADPLRSTVLGIDYSTNSALGVMHLEWDATTDVLAWALPQNSDKFCFRDHGGLKNTAGTGITGDITLTTTGLAAGDKVTFILSVRPY